MIMISSISHVFKGESQIIATSKLLQAKTSARACELLICWDRPCKTYKNQGSQTMGGSMAAGSETWTWTLPFPHLRDKSLLKVSLWSNSANLSRHFWETWPPILSGQPRSQLEDDKMNKSMWQCDTVERQIIYEVASCKLPLQKMLLILGHGPSWKTKTLATAFFVFKVKASELNPQEPNRMSWCFLSNLISCQSVSRAD